MEGVAAGTTKRENSYRLSSSCVCVCARASAAGGAGGEAESCQCCPTQRR